MNRILEKAEDIKELAEILLSCDEVTKYDDSGHNEAWSLAHAFSDIEESFSRILEFQLPKLNNMHIQNLDINKLLLEIGEEFRHILYHIMDTRFYGYLSEGRKKDK